MKTLFFTIAILTFGLNASATLSNCNHTDRRWERDDEGRDFESSVTNNYSSYSGCGNGDELVFNLYSIPEIDAMNVKTNNSIKSLQTRVFTLEQAAAQDVQISDSAKEELKKQIIEELKKEFILTPKN